VHRLPAAEAHVETIFIRRHDTPPSRALAAFLAATKGKAAKGKGRGLPRP
jgi:hypothetical protein